MKHQQKPSSKQLRGLRAEEGRGKKKRKMRKKETKKLTRITSLLNNWHDFKRECNIIRNTILH